MKSMLQEEREEFQRRAEIVAGIADQKRAYELATRDINNALGTARRAEVLSLLALIVSIFLCVLLTGK